MDKMMTTALAGAFLGLAIGGASAAVPVIPGPFANYNLNGNFVIEAHGFENNNTNPTDIGENAILGVVTFDGVGGVVPGANVFFSHADSSTSNDQINCLLTITGGNYAVNTLTGMGDLTITLSAGALPGGAGCFSISDNASLKFAFVLNNSGVVVSIIATSASVQLIGFTPLPLVITDQTINQMVMTGTLRLQGSASN